ncbi:hypothetical protein PAXINDRAFT_5842 [Paxillus involutus ATCC 200175]|nr:hypothetical protein PAXINDRAFT_5842 [Paxillus involutus ATCC 200175]
MSATLSPTQSPRTPKRKSSTRRGRSVSHLPPVQSQEAHDAAFQLQAHRLGHKVERQEGSAVSSPQWRRIRSTVE